MTEIAHYRVIIANELSKTTGWCGDLVKVYDFYKDKPSFLAHPSGPVKMNQLVLDNIFIANRKTGFISRD